MGFCCLVHRTRPPLPLDAAYVNTKAQVIKTERRVLKELGFCVHVKHPHKASRSNIAYTHTAATHYYYYVFFFEPNTLSPDPKLL